MATTEKTVEQVRASLGLVRPLYVQGYVLTAKSKGKSNVGVMVHHVLPNSMIPIITIAGVQVGGLLGGAILTEAVFVWPGMGQLLIDSVFSRDFPVIQASILVHAAISAG